MRPFSSLRARAALTGLVLLLLTSCTDGESPVDEGQTRSMPIALQPIFQQGAVAESAQDVARIRWTVRRVSDGSTVAQDVEEVDPNAAAWTIGLEVPVGGTAVQIEVVLELLSANDEIVWSGITDPITVGGGQSPPPVQRVQVVRGPPGNLFVTGISVDPQTANAVRGTTVELTADVETSDDGDPPQVIWTALDPSLVSVQSTGRRTATATALQEGVGRIEATAGEATASVAITVTPRLADLGLTKSVDPDVAFEGDAVTFTVEIVNGGPQAATGVSVLDVLPEGLLFQAASGDGSYDNATGVWTVGDLGVDEGATLVLTAQVEEGTSGQTLVNTAVSRGSTGEEDPEPANDEASASVSVERRQADVAVTKTADRTDVFEGEVVTFTITAANAGPQTATGVRVMDQLPNGLVFQGADPAGDYDPATGMWSVGDLPPNGMATLTLQALVAAGTAGTSVTNTAVSQGLVDQQETNPNNDEASATVQVAMPRADLAVTKSAEPTEASEGDDVTFTVTVTNDGPDDATGVSLTDVLPTGLTFVSADPAARYDAATGLWTVGTLAAQASATLTLVATVDEGTAGTTLTNTARSNGLVAEVDPDPGNDEASASVDVQQVVADLRLAKSVDASEAFAGDAVTFQVTVTNDGPADATGVSITDALPAGLTFVSADPAAAYDEASGAWTVGDLPSGGSATLTLVASVDAGTAGTTLTNTARSEGLTDQEDPDGTNDEASASVAVLFQSDLAVTKSVDRKETFVGEAVTFTVVVRNVGPDPATGVVVRDQLDDALSIASVSPSVGSFDRDTRTWNVGDLKAGGSASMVLDALVGEVPDGTVLTNVVQVSGGGGAADPVTSNNEASASVTVRTFRAFDGSITISDPSDLEDFRNERWTLIEGDLIISGSSLVNVDGLESLVEVVGSLVIAANGSLTSLGGLANLVTVGGMEVTNNALLPSLEELTSLDRIAGDLWLAGNPAISSRSNLPALVEVRGSVQVEGGGVVLGLPVLEAIAANLVVGGSSGFDVSILEVLALPALSNVGAEVFVYNNPNLTTLDLSKLESVGANPPAGLEQVASTVPSLRDDRPRRAPAASSREEILSSKIGDLTAQIRTVEAQMASLGDAAAEEKDLAEELEDLAEDLEELQEEQEERRQAGPVPGDPLNNGYGNNSLTIVDNYSLSVLRLSSLAFVAGSLIVEYNEALTALRLLSLQAIGGSLYVYDGYLTALALPLLTRVGQDFVVAYNSAALQILAPLLATIGGDFYLYDNVTLATVRLAALAVVLGYVEVEYNTWNSALELPVLQEVGEDFYVSDNEGLSRIEVATGSSLGVGGDLEINYNQGLVDILFPGLETVGPPPDECAEECGDDLEVYENPDLQSIVMPNLRTVGDDLDIQYNGAASDLLKAPENRASIRLDAIVNPPLTLDFSSLFRVGEDIDLDDNWGLSEILFPSLVEVGISRGGLEIDDHPGLERISAPVLTIIADDLEIDYNGTAGTPLVVELPALRFVGDDVDIDANPALEVLDLPALVEIGDDYEIDDHTALRRLSAPNLVTVGEGTDGPGDFEVWDNGQPGGSLILDFPRLQRVGADVEISAGPNQGLETVSFPALTMATNFEVIGQPDVTSVSAQVLPELPGSLLIESNPSLTGVSFPNLAMLGPGTGLRAPLPAGMRQVVEETRARWEGTDKGALVAPPLMDQTAPPSSLVLYQNPMLTGLGFPVLGTIEGNILIQFNDALQDLAGLSAVTSTVNAVFVMNNQALSDVSGLDGIGDAAGADPVVTTDFMIVNNPSLCQSDAAALFSILDAKYTGSAAGGSVDTASGNQNCGSTAPVTGLIFCAPSTGGDRIDRGFYVPSYPGSDIQQVTVFLSASVAGSYTVEMTVRELTYSGTILATAQASVALTANSSNNLPVSFLFPSAPATAQGTTVTFSMELISGPSTPFYATTTDPSCPIVETNGTNPPLDSFRRNGMGVVILESE